MSRRGQNWVWHLGERTLKSAVSQEWVDFVHADTNSWKLKVILIILVDRTLKSAVSQDWIHVMSWFLGRLLILLSILDF